jgi:epoxyqueuosine reductase
VKRRRTRDIVFEDADVPSVSDAKFVIPRKMKWVVAIAIPMDLDLISRTPTALGDAGTAMGYSHSAFVVSSLAEFIRGLGYEAIPCVNDTAQSIPFAHRCGHWGIEPPEQARHAGIRPRGPPVQGNHRSADGM